MSVMKLISSRWKRGCEKMDCIPDCEHYDQDGNEKPCKFCIRLCTCTDYYNPMGERLSIKSFLAWLITEVE